MTDKEKLDSYLCAIITSSTTCETCAFKHYFEGERVAYCFFALDCIIHDHKDYRKVDD